MCVCISISVFMCDSDMVMTICVYVYVCRLGVPEGSLVCASTVDFATVPSGMDTGQRRPAPIDNEGGDAKRIKIEKV